MRLFLVLFFSVVFSPIVLLGTIYEIGVVMFNIGRGKAKEITG